MKAPASESGFSLIESILTIVIISISLVVLISAWSGAAKRSGDPFWHAKAAYLGQAYIEEILTKRYDENTPVGGLPACTTATCTAEASFGPEGSESRATFDDVDDYDGLSETPSENALGVVRDEYNSYQVEVNVSYAGTDFSRPDRTLKLIEVLVTPPGETTQRFTVYRGNY